MLSLPKNTISYIKALMCVFENANCVSLSKIIGCSHDSLARILNERKLSWQTLLESFTLRIFGKLHGGWLIIDDTVISKRFARKIENLAWVFDSKIGKSIRGLNIVLLAWSNGRTTIPLMIKVYRKANKKTKIDLAIELISYAHLLLINPKYITFDSWYAADKLLKKIVGYKWIFVTQIKKNRKINGIQAKEVYRYPYWMSQGELSGGIIISVVRNGKKYFATNDLTLTKKEILSFYKGRWLVETVFRMLHSKLGLDQCESRSLHSQTTHFYFCLLAYIVLEKEKFITGKTIYQIKRDCSFDFKKADNILNKLIFQSA